MKNTPSETFAIPYGGLGDLRPVDNMWNKKTRWRGRVLGDENGKYTSREHADITLCGGGINVINGVG